MLILLISLLLPVVGAFRVFCFCGTTRTRARPRRWSSVCSDLLRRCSALSSAWFGTDRRPSLHAASRWSPGVDLFVPRSSRSACSSRWWPAFLWPITSLYAIGYMRGHHEENQTRFFFFFAISIAGALGIAFSGNLFTLFVFYEFLTFCTFPLVTHHQSEEAKKSGRIYLGILLTTSVGLPARRDHLDLAARRDASTSRRGRHPRRYGFGRRPRGDPRPIRLRGGQGGGHAVPPLASRRDGRADAGVRPPARRCGREGGRLHGAQGRRVRLRHRPASVRWPRPTWLAWAPRPRSSSDRSSPSRRTT